MIDLQPFCGTEETRHYLMKPFSKDGFTWATNGNIAIRVPLRHDVPEFDAKVPLKVEMPFKGHEGATFKALPKVKWPESDPSKACETCGGSGHQHDCPDCECTCEGCDGSGQETIMASVSVRSVLFDSKYVRMILDMPSSTFSSAPKDAEPAPFTFEGGIGVLMPLRRKLGVHLGDIYELPRLED